MSAPSSSSRYKKRPESVWVAVKADYLAGSSAAECAERYGVGEYAIYERSSRQGWGKRRPCPKQGAEPGPAAPATPTVDETPQAAARSAFRMAAENLARGKAGPALAFTRLAAGLAALILPEPPKTEADWQADAEERRAWKAELKALIEARALDHLAYMFQGGSYRNQLLADGRYQCLPEYAIDASGRIVRTQDLPSSWFDETASEPPDRDFFTGGRRRPMFDNSAPGEDSGDG